VNYLKCTLAGLAAVFVIFGILPILAVVAFFLIFAVRHGGEEIGIDVSVWHFGSPVLWVSALIVFGIGFFWELRRLAK
jgi:hypothetical protein